MCKALYARYGLLCYLHISQGKAHRWLGTRRVLALYRKTNNWIRRTITEPFPTLSLFISCPSLENTATNKSLPAQRAHSLLELPSHFLQSPASPPGYARISGWVLQKGPQIGVQAALSKKKNRLSYDSELEGAGARRGGPGIWGYHTMHQGSEPWDKLSSRDEKSSFAADNICFILKVAKESSSWANIVPVQCFIASVSHGVQTAGISAHQISPAPFTFQTSESVCYRGCLTPCLLSLS